MDTKLRNKILIVDFGSQYTQLIARRVRELDVYSEVINYKVFKKELVNSSVKGVIFSGSHASVFSIDTRSIDIKNISTPILAICYGAQKIIFEEKGRIEASKNREYGKSSMEIIKKSPIFETLKNTEQVWMSHTDSITELPNDYEVLSRTTKSSITAFKHKEKNIFGLQFHPEVQHSPCGKQILKNFILKICLAQQEWSKKDFIEEKIDEIKQEIGKQKVIMGISGGVDSTIAAVLLHKAIGKQLHCILVDNGLLRKNEFENILDMYKKLHLNVEGVRAKEVFYKRLQNVTDTEKKRKIIGKVFIEVFEKEAKKMKDIHWLGQGTIYPDIIESSAPDSVSTKIKSHHNVGGLPPDMSLKLIEPIKTLFKDEVREIGTLLGVPEEILQRHPFPGPGLGIRIIGAIDAKKIDLLQEIDAVFIEALKKMDLYKKIWQAAAILLPIKTTGVMGDARSYHYTTALRAVISEDGMTADWYPFEKKELSFLSNEITNKIEQVNRVVYDITSKPPATIEWE